MPVCWTVNGNRCAGRTTSAVISYRRRRATSATVARRAVSKQLGGEHRTVPAGFCLLRTGSSRNSAHRRDECTQRAACASEGAASNIHLRAEGRVVRVDTGSADHEMARMGEDVSHRRPAIVGPAARRSLVKTFRPNDMEQFSAETCCDLGGRITKVEWTQKVTLPRCRPRSIFTGTSAWRQGYNIAQPRSRL